MPPIQHGTSTFRRINRALFLGAFVTFANLYCVQPLMPAYSKEFHVAPAVSSLTLSVSTAALSICLIFAGSLSEALGRKSVMTVSLFAAAALQLLTPLSGSFGMLLLVRSAMGVALAGLPAIAMAYLAEEVDPRSLGLAMGLYISGNTVGGLAGRLLTGVMTDAFSWRIALAVVGAVGLAASLWFAFALPPSRNFQPRPLAPGALLRSLGRHLLDPGLLCLYGVGFLLMGSFVTLYNYISYLLMDKPYSLSHATVSYIFVVYLVGTFSSTWMGRLADKLGRRKVLWVGICIMLAGVLLTLPVVLWVKILGVSIFTFGFFGSHSIASSWVGRRALVDRAQASSLYLLFYYTGSSVGGFVGGLFWSRFGWGGVVGMIAALLVSAVGLSAVLAKIQPVAQVGRS